MSFEKKMKKKAREREIVFLCKTRHRKTTFKCHQRNKNKTKIRKIEQIKIK